MAWFKDLFRRDKPSQKQASAMRAADALAGFTTEAEWTQWDSRNAVLEGFERNLWAYRCIRKRMTSISMVPIYAERKVNGEWERAPDHPLTELMERPNPLMDLPEFMEILTAKLDTAGQAFFHVVRGGRGGKVPLELWPLPTNNVKPIQDKGSGRYVSGYKMDYGTFHHTFAPEEILHVKMTHPEDRMNGHAPLKAGGMAVDVDNEAADMQKVSLQNRGVPDGIFKLQGEAITREEWKEAKRQVREQHLGKSNFREPWVLAHADWQQMSLGPVELDLNTSRLQTSKHICAALGVPHVLVSAGDDPTYSNYAEARRVWWQDELVPGIKSMVRQMSQFLAPAFGDDLRLEPDFNDVPALRENMKEKVDTANVLWNMGIPMAEVNNRLGLGFNEDAIPNAQAGYVPGNRQQVTPSNSQDEAVQSLTGPQVQALADLARQVQDGEMSADAARAVIAASFPSLTDEMVEAILEPTSDPKQGADPEEIKRVAYLAEYK